jgi:hypothetical protein
MSGLIRWSIAAAIGGLVGASAWAGITYFTGYEIGWIAWGVGFVVGAAVRMSASSTTEVSTGFGPGTVAAVGALLALLVGKYAAVHLLVNKEMDNTSEMTMTSDDMVEALADEIVEARESEGKSIDWPAQQSGEFPSQESDYPPELWAEARAKWDAVSPADQQQRIDTRKAQIIEMTSQFKRAIVQEGFKESFSPIDLLFFGLALFTAFRMGSGATG